MPFSVESWECHRQHTQRGQRPDALVHLLALQLHLFAAFAAAAPAVEWRVGLEAFGLRS